MDEKRGWKSFQKLKFDRKSFTKRARKAETATTKHAHKFVVKKLATIRDIRQQVMLWLMIVGVLIVAAAVQMLWFQESYKTVASTEGGVYAEAVLGPIDTLNPLYATSNAERSAAQLIFSRLFDYDKTGHLRDDLVTSMTVDKSQQVYTVSLRQDASWHDGRPVTAADVVYTVEAMKDPDVRSVMRSSWLDVRAVEVDSYTVKFSLPAPHAAFPHALTFAVLPKHILSSVPAGSMRESIFSMSPVGSGPFSLRLLQSGGVRDNQKIVHLNAWPDYYRGQPKLARFELHAYDDVDAIARALKIRDVNAAIDVDTIVGQLPKSMSVESYPTNTGVYALLNTSSPVLSDVNIRRALQLSIDNAALRKAAGNGVPALDGPFLKGQIENVNLPQAPNFNPTMAESLLDKAGWKQRSEGEARTNRRNAPLKLQLKVLKGRYDAAVDYLVKEWKQLGVDVVVTKFDATDSAQSYARAVLQPRDYDILVTRLDIGADPDIFAYWHSSQANTTGLNFSNYRNAVSDDALLSARLRSEQALRAQKYRAFTKQWYADAPAIGLYQTVVVYTHSKMTDSLRKGHVMPSSTDRYSDVIYWTAEKAPVYKTP